MRGDIQTDAGEAEGEEKEWRLGEWGKGVRESEQEEGREGRGKGEKCGECGKREREREREREER